MYCFIAAVFSSIDKPTLFIEVKFQYITMRNADSNTKYTISLIISQVVYFDPGFGSEF